MCLCNGIALVAAAGGKGKHAFQAPPLIVMINNTILSTAPAGFPTHGATPRKYFGSGASHKEPTRDVPAPSETSTHKPVPRCGHRTGSPVRENAQPHSHRELPGAEFKQGKPSVSMRKCVCQMRRANAAAVRDTSEFCLLQSVNLSRAAAKEP